MDLLLAQISSRTQKVTSRLVRRTGQARARRNYPENLSKRCELNSNITTLAIKIVDV
jgi:hypothetical protein